MTISYLSRLLLNNLLWLKKNNNNKKNCQSLRENICNEKKLYIILNIDMPLQVRIKMLRFKRFLYSWSLYVKEIKCRLSLLKQFSIKVWHAYQLYQNELISFTLFFCCCCFLSEYHNTLGGNGPNLLIYIFKELY